MKIAILTSANQWFVPYSKELNNQLNDSKLFFNHKEIDDSFSIVFILSYHSLIEEEYLKLHKHNIVIHESDLPKGKGWAPMSWQVLENKDNIVFSMFEAGLGIDDGNIYMRQSLQLTGNELNAELRYKQAQFSINMCIEFIENYTNYKNPLKQKGNETFYKKRTKEDSELDINKTINEQFNLLRIVDNKDYPAFFYKNNKKYLIKIEEDKNENR